jgi:hypothetical protein
MKIVRTGKYRQGDEAKLHGKNTLVFDSVGDAIHAVVST